MFDLVDIRIQWSRGVKTKYDVDNVEWNNCLMDFNRNREVPIKIV